MIETRVTQAAQLACAHDLHVEINGSTLKVFDDRSSASLLFRSDHIFLEQLGVNPEQRRRHYGSNLLDLAIAIANKAHLRLELIAESPLRPIQADLSQSALQAWYRRRKFVAADDVLMRRFPDSDAAKSSFTGFRPI
jgi:ribosomal protein S18 acetylase RimI-like enzyme